MNLAVVFVFYLVCLVFVVICLWSGLFCKIIIGKMLFVVCFIYIAGAIAFDFYKTVILGWIIGCLNRG